MDIMSMISKVNPIVAIVILYAIFIVYYYNSVAYIHKYIYGPAHKEVIDKKDNVSMFTYPYSGKNVQEIVKIVLLPLYVFMVLSPVSLLLIDYKQINKLVYLYAIMMLYLVAIIWMIIHYGIYKATGDSGTYEKHYRPHWIYIYYGIPIYAVLILYMLRSFY